MLIGADRKNYFQGSLHDLEAARAATQLPVLRKDFTIDRLQIFEAAAHGADAILLIAAILDTNELQHLREVAHSLGLAALVEVHNHDELTKAIDSGRGNYWREQSQFGYVRGFA